MFAAAQLRSFPLLFTFHLPFARTIGKAKEKESDLEKNKAGYTATEVACGWAGTVFEVTRPFGQE